MPTNTLTLEIDGNSECGQVSSFSADYTLDNRPTARLRLIYSGARPFDEGDELIVRRASDNVKLFTGLIQSATESTRNRFDTHVFADLTCSGYESLADRRLAKRVYRDTNAGAVVADLIDRYLAADGVTAGTIADGVEIVKVVYAYRPVSDVLRELADASGYVWFIDKDKALHFLERGAMAAPWGIDANTTAPVQNFRVERSLSQYRNTQALGTLSLTSERTESFAGDGKTRTWNVEFPIAEQPEVRMNGILQTVGISGPDAGYDYYWSKSSSAVAQDSGQPPIGTDWALEFVPVGIGAQAFSSFSARGDYAVGIDNVNNLIYLFNISNQFASVAQILNPDFDDLYSVTFVDEEYVAVAYENSSDHFVTLFRRVGASLTPAGSPVSVPGLTQFSPECSNGQYLVGAQSSDLLLFKFEKSGEVLSLEETVSSAGASQLPKAVWYNDYLAYAAGQSPVFKVYKLNRSSDTLAEIFSHDEGLGNQIIACAWVDHYVYAGFSSGSAPEVANTIIRHDLDTSTDTVTRLGPTAMQNVSNTANLVSVNNFLIVCAFVQFPHMVEYYRVDVDTGDIQFFDMAINEGQTSTISLAVSRNIGNTFIFGCGPNTLGKPLFILRQAPGVMSVKYRGQFRTVIEVQDVPEVAARSAAEGGSGIYEAFQDAGTENASDAHSAAQAILARHGILPRSVSFDTRVDGLVPGQSLPVVWPSLDLDESILIESVSVRDTSGILFWSVRATSGDVGNWQRFWRSLKPPDPVNISGDILPLTVSVYDTLSIGDTASALTEPTGREWGDGRWARMEWR